MNWHEIVNETIGERDVVITYCPLCNSSVVFDRNLNGELLSFGNTGALYENAMVMYDRETESYWYHINGEAIRGRLLEDRLTIVPSLVLTWEEWKDRYPETRILSLDTGFRRNYLSDPFRGYDALNSSPAFPVSITSNILPPKERVVGISINGVNKAYPVKLAQNKTIMDNIGGIALEIVGSPTGVTAEVLVINSEGKRERAAVTSSFWFAWFAAYPDTEVFGL